MTDGHERSRAAPEPASLESAELLQLQWLQAAYWARADGDTAYAISDLFTDNSVLTLGTLTLEGSAAIERFFLDRDEAHCAAGRITRHVACNFLAQPEGRDRVRVRSTVMVFAGQGPLPLPIALPSGIADFDDVCIRTEKGQWKFFRRAGRSIFIGPDVPSFAR